MAWWRRNRWGLIALVPALAATLALSAEDLYYGVYARQPRQPVPANTDGRYELRGTQIRLVNLGRATDLKRYSGSAFVAPANVTFWRARIEFSIPKTTTSPPTTPPTTTPPTTTPPKTEPPETELPKTELGGCTITLEDSAGRIFTADPHDLLIGAADVVPAGCTADFDVPDPSRYVNTIYFALPRDAQPVAVRIHDVLSLPRYVRLSPG